MRWILYTCIFSFLFRLRILDHGREEPEEATEPAPVEEINPELTEGKPRCISPIIFSFSFNHYFMLIMFVH
jgi:hypothetical protein